MTSTSSQRICTWIAAVALTALLPWLGRADVVTYYTETWTPDDDLRGWDNVTDFATISHDNVGDFLKLTFDELGEPSPGTDYDLMRTVSAPATDYFVGDYDAARAYGVEFDFLAEDTLPADAEFRFTSGTRTWAAELDTSAMTVGDWRQFRVNFTYASFLPTVPGPGEAEFLSDLTSVDWIGIYVRRDGLGAQIYGLDNMMLYVPEPAEVLLVLTALFGLAGTWRRKLLAIITR